MPLKDRLGLTQDPIFLMDGTAFVFRAFYAYRDMTRSDGFPTNALYTVLRMLLKILREENPEHFLFILDGKGPTFRHELYDEYKANRSATPEELVQQLAPIREGVKLLGIPVTVSDGCEADDCIASLAARLKAERPVVIVGADKDLKQCLDDNVYMWDPGTKTEKLTTIDDFRKETGLEPAQWPEFQAVIGDSSDNIPGVPGIGPKTAQKIFDVYPSIQAINDNLHDAKVFKPKQKEKFETNMEAVGTYLKLTTLALDRCADLTLDSLRRRDPDFAKARDFMNTYEFRTLARELPAPRDAEAPAAGTMKTETRGTEQLSLFGEPATATEKKPSTPAETIASLPDLDGASVGLFVEGGKIRLGVGDEEFAWAGPVAELAGGLAKAARIACPEVKPLLRAGEAWNGIPVGAWFDLSLAAYLLNPEERDYSWQRLADRYAVDAEVSEENPGLLALRMAEALEKSLTAAHLLDLMRDLETPLIPVLARMEQRGIRIDRAAFGSFLHEAQAQLTALTRKVYEAAGRQFNLRSSQQLAEVLFDHLGLKPSGKTPGGAKSTSQAVLEKLAGQHPVVELILEYRTLEKLRSTYLEPMPAMADEADRIHTTFNQLATATGRLSSSAPNLQNIPIRGQFGPRMRACFVAPEGRRLVAADYSQIELRVLAHASEDPAMLDAFSRGLDIHSGTAAILYDKSVEEVEVEERRNAKTINFGLIYGMGPQKLAKDLGITMAQAKEFIARYFERLATLKKFYEGVEERAKVDGFVTTIAGRRRLLPGIHSRNNQTQALARRQAVNTLIQGSAADIIKLAMLAADADEQLAELDAQCILQVHDELLLETPTQNAEAAGNRLSEIMSTVMDLKVPLKVDWGFGQNWDQAH